jgi:hypothetical protein
MNLALIQVYALLAHMVGDYIIQTNHMAQTKTKSWAAAISHAVSYTLPFTVLYLVTGSRQLTPVPSLLFIGVTHLLIDRYRLAVYVLWLRNQFAPKEYRYSWDSRGLFGENPSDSGKPFIAFWVMVLADNSLHLICNAFALAFWS